MKYSSAVIGLGNIGFQYSHKFASDSRNKTWSHVDAYLKSGLTDLVGVVDPDAQKAKFFKKFNPQIPVYSSVKDLFSRHSIDVVSLATPISTHCPLTVELLDHPVKAIFCEKPIALNQSEALRMIKLSQEKKVVLAVNHLRRWDCRYQMAADIIKRKKIGEVKAVSAIYTAKVFNVGTHLFDTIRMLIGKNPISASGLFVGEKNSDSSVTGWIEFEGGVSCSILTFNRPMDQIFEIDVIGDQGRLRIIENGEKTEFFTFQPSQRYPNARELVKQKLTRVEINDRFCDAISDIVSVVKGKTKKVSCTGQDGYWALAIAQALTESAETRGRTVRLKKVIS